jgi:hypothetical protein
MKQTVHLSKTIRNKSLADIFGVYTEWDIVLLPKKNINWKIEVWTLDISDLSPAQQGEYRTLLAWKTPLYNI